MNNRDRVFAGEVFINKERVIIPLLQFYEGEIIRM